MKSWTRWIVAAAVLVVAGIDTTDATALRGLAVAHGGHSHEYEHEREALDATTTHNDEILDENHSEVAWVDNDTITRDIPTDVTTDDTTVGGDADDVPTDDANVEDDSVGGDADSSGSDEDGEGSKSFAFDTIAGEAMSDEVAGVVPPNDRGATGGYAVQKGKATPIGESAAAAKPISEISESAIQKDPVGYGVATNPPTIAPAPAPVPPPAPVPASKPIKGKTDPVPIGESAAAAKPITDIDPSAIQKDPKAYGVVTVAPLSDTAAAAKPNPAVKPSNPAAQRLP